MAILYALEDIEVDETDVLDAELLVGDCEGYSHELTLLGASRMFRGFRAGIPGFNRAVIHPSPPIPITAKIA